MNTSCIARVWLALGLVLSLGAYGAETALVDFELEDPLRGLHRRADWDGRPVVLFVSTREGQMHNADFAWSRPISAAIAARPDGATFAVARIGQVPPVPAFVRGMVREAFVDASNPVALALIDWEGRFTEAYALEPDAYHLLAFDADHALVLSEALRTFDDATLRSTLVRLELVKSARIQP